MNATYWPRPRRAALAAAKRARRDSGQVKIDSGTLAGTTGASPDVRVFKGIPFAASPLGANRWRAPQPVGAWSGVAAAAEFAAALHARRCPADRTRRGAAANERGLSLSERLDHGRRRRAPSGR